jgi:hypothetical protein
MEPMLAAYPKTTHYDSTEPPPLNTRTVKAASTVPAFSIRPQIFAKLVIAYSNRLAGEA